MPTRLNRNKGSFAGARTYTMGANGDSYYEYLLKMWLLKQKKVIPPEPNFAEKAGNTFAITMRLGATPTSAAHPIGMLGEYNLGVRLYSPNISL